MGSVKWDCLQSLSEVHLNIGQEEYAGLGYVERLDMTLAPWQLPIKELHWGRFLSQDCSLIWIQWRGPHPLTLVCLNGEKFEMAEVSTSHVSWDSGRLDISNPVVLRNGPIVKTALSQIPGVRRLFPESILLMDECKWRSRGELEQGGGTCTGWVIHEVIHFG